MASDDVADESQGPAAFPVVSIAVAAAGLEVLKDLLATLPPDKGVAFLVAHRAPQHDAALPEELGRVTRMPVHEAVDGVRIQPNRVYIIPPDTKPVVSKSILRLESLADGQREPAVTDQDELRRRATLAGQRTDEFLRTLAHDLRTPLGAIRNAVEIMHMAGDDPQAFGRVRDLVERQVRQLTHVVDDLANIAGLVQRKSEQKEVVPPAGPVSGPNQRRVLVVDDNPDQLESLGLLFELMGHEVCLTATGPDALAVIASFKPDVAVIDIGLPGMSGYDLARLIREQPAFADMVLVAQTGWGEEKDQRRSREAGFDHHLVKPINRDALERLFNDLPRSHVATS